MSALSQRGLLGWLAVLVAGVAASVWQWQAPPDAHPEHRGGHHHATGGGPQPMFSWQAHEARHIELRTADRSLDMRLTEAGWRGEPPGFDAGAFVAMFSRARADRRFEPMSGGDYGLEPGVMRLVVKDAQEKVLAGLLIGERLPDGIGRYVRDTAGLTITVIPDYQVRPALHAAEAAWGVVLPAARQSMDGRATPAQVPLTEALPARMQAAPAASGSAARAGAAMVAKHTD